jgi:hypothetical protein
VFAVRQHLCCAFFVGRTTKRLFAVRFLSGARQRKTHGKDLVCRAPDKTSTTKILFAVRFFLAHGKVFFFPYAQRINQVSFIQKYIVVRFNFGARQTHVLAVHFCYSAWQSIFFTYFPYVQNPFAPKKLSSPLNIFNSTHTKCHTSC